MPLANVCDGIPHCPDSSDEVGTLCRHVVCPTHMYRCNYGACVSRAARCDGLADCVDASDEIACDRDANDVCSDRDFQCSTVNQECIPFAEVCNAGTHYSVSGCSGCRPGEVVPELTRLDYACDVEGTLQGASEIYCQNNRWFPGIPSCTFSNETEGITCPALSETHDAIKRCEAMWGPHEGWLPCDRPLPVGTRVFLECPAFYERSKGSSSVMCLYDGTAATINSVVGPVCVPWHSDETLLEYQRNGGLGLVAGMGLTENDTFSPVLRVTTMKIIYDDECRQNQNRDFRKYLTYTSFCAGWANGTGVCNGDSGGGLVLQRPNSSIWEVHGVVSVSPRRLGTNVCDPNFYAVFTKVSMYTNWIHEIIESIPIIGLSDLNQQPNRDNIVV
ncbi:hypothetical protein DBV15_01391 [Temnothorax longispinosus]|uniref:Peptidase S1 domain-containing protein n=1 Tax=Temnothorax longispinosus TaxID=300112 RepID=A0A4S2L0T2_9HYME|nr:hypothetical protein DBV15_01391 [Temnothorax longispinosus]